MRLFTRTGATALDDPEYGHFTGDTQGGFDLPDPLAARLHAFHVGGRPLWETEVERAQRTAREELERRRDPATLQALVEQLLAAQTPPAAAAAAPESAEPVEKRAPAKRAAKKTAATQQ